MKNDLISIIIPIYKVEDYLERCVESVLRQSYSNVEIILVDDGSPDNCPQICDEYAKKDKRIKVVHKENGGLSDARNFGIDIAKGKYLAFIDSDDYINDDFIKILYENLILNNADMSMCEYETFDDDTSAHNDYTNDIMILDRNQLLNRLVSKNNAKFTVVWNKLYRKELFNHLRFDVGRINEDAFIMHKIFDNSEIAVISSAKLYYYYQRQGSITKASKYTAKNLDSIYAIIDRYEFLKDTELSEKALESLCLGIAYNYFIAKQREADKQILKQIRYFYNNYYSKATKKTFKLFALRYFLDICYIVFCIKHKGK